MLKLFKGALGVILLAGLSVVSASAKDKAAIDPKIFNFEHVSCKGGGNEIRIVVNKIKDSVGLISADLYPNKEDGFLKSQGRITQVKFAAKSPQTVFCMRAPGDGEFAIALYHDENANGKLDKGTFGIPSEPWGISNNPKVRFAAPSVESAIFNVDTTGAKVEIELN